MDPTPYVLTLSCALRKTLPTIEEPFNADAQGEPLKPLEVGTAFMEASETRKDPSSSDQEGASAYPLLRQSGGAGGLVFETSLTITSPTKQNHASKVCHASAAANSRVVVSTDPVGEEARRALRRHRRRLAKIVVDQWLYAARHRLLATKLRKLRNDLLLKACLKAWRDFRDSKQMDKKAKELRVQATRRRGFKEWIAFLHRQLERKKMEVDVVRKLCQNKLRAAWNSWTAFLKSNARKFLENTQPDESVGQRDIEWNGSEWSSGSSSNLASSFRVASVLSRAFQYWTESLSSLKKANKMHKLAEDHYSSCNIRKVFAGVRCLRGRRKVKLAHIQLAEDHWKFRELRKRLQLWHSACGFLYARRILKQQAATKRRQWLLPAVFQAWTDYTSAKSWRKARGLELLSKHTELNMKRVWNSWMNVRDVLKLDRMNEELALRLFEATRLAADFHGWLDFFKHRKKRAKNNEKAEALRLRTLLTLAFGGWKEYRLKKMQQKLAAIDAMLHRQTVLGRNVFRAWEDWLANRHQKAKERKDALATYSNILQRWACERILAHGLRQQSVKLNYWLEMQAARLVVSLNHAAPFARKWRSHTKKIAKGSRASDPKTVLQFPMRATEMKKSVPELQTTPEKRSPWPGSLMDIRPLNRPAARRPRFVEL